MCGLVYLNMGIHSSCHHIKPAVQFCTCTGQHSFCHTLDCFDYPCTKGCNIMHRHSVNTILHIPSQEEIQGCDIREAWGTRRLVHHDKPICKEMFNQETLLQCGGMPSCQKMTMVAVLPAEIPHTAINSMSGQTMHVIVSS